MAQSRVRARRTTTAAKESSTEKKVTPSKPKPEPRTKPRVEDTEPSKATKHLVERAGGTLAPIGATQALVGAQMSEVVPVAQYANVVLGPVQVNWVLENIDLNALAEVDWDSDDPLTKEQQAVYDRARSALQGTMHILSDLLASERAIVEESVRMHNLKKQQEEEGKASGSTGARKRK